MKKRSKTILNTEIDYENGKRFPGITVASKDYCITGRANPISCAVGLR